MSLCNKVFGKVILNYQGNSRDLHYLITRDFLIDWGHPGWSGWAFFPVRRGEGPWLSHPGGTLQQYCTMDYPEDGFGCSQKCVRGGRLKGSGRKLQERKLKLNVLKTFFPMKRVKQWHTQAAQRGWMFYTFDIFNYQNGQALNNLVWTHIWPCLSRRLDQRPPDVSSRLNYLVVLWFCDVSLHMQILEKIWNLSSTLKLR